MRPEVGSADSGRRRSASGKIAAIMLEVSGGPGLTLTDVARRTRLPVSTTHRLLGELVEGRLLVRNSDGVYTVCRALRGLVGSRERAAQARSQVNLVLEDLGIATGLRARFGVWNELGVSYLERAADRGSGRCSSGLTILPAHATALGKALLAHAPPPVVQEVLDAGLPSYTPHTLTTAWQLHAALAATRRKGMATSRWELREGECAVAVPVFGPHGAVVGALELAIDNHNFANRLHDARLILVVAARGLSRQLAFDPGALPTGSGRAPLRWPADPTSAALAWSEPEAAG